MQYCTIMRSPCMIDIIRSIYSNKRKKMLHSSKQESSVLEQQALPARYLDICASLHWWLLMPLSTYALSRHVRTRYSISQPHDIILWLSIDFSTIISSWFLDYMIPYFPIPFISCHVRFSPLRCCTTSKCNIWGELLYIHDTLSYIILTMYL